MLTIFAGYNVLWDLNPPLYLHHTLMKQCQNAEQFMPTLSEHQTIQPVLVRVYMARALVLVMFVSNYVVVLFSFDIVTNVLISPCIVLLIAYIIWHLPNIFFSQNLNMNIYNCVSNCQEYSLKWLIKLLDLSNAFLVEYLLTAISSMPDISTSVLKQTKNIKLTCVAVTQ